MALFLYMYCVYICIYPCSKGTHVYVYIYYVFMHKRRIYKWQMLRCFVFWLYCVLWSKFVTITGNVSFCQHSSWICEMLAILCCVSISISHNHIAKFVEFHLTLMGEHTKCSGDNCGRGCGSIGIQSYVHHQCGAYLMLPLSKLCLPYPDGLHPPQ